MANIKNIDLNLLIVLDVLLDERSVSKAANRLNLSQPAVSGALKKLRLAFNDPLFVRSRQGVRPTPSAVELIAPVKAVLQDIDTILSSSDFSPETAEATFTIAATDYAQMTLLAPLMQAVNAQAPNIRFSIVSTDARRMPEQFDRREIDFAITVPEMAPPNVRSKTLFEDRYVCAIDKHHRDPAGAHTLDGFCDLHHVLVAPSSDGFIGPTDEVLSGLGRQRRVTVSVPNFLSLPGLLEGSDFIAVAPERSLQPFTDKLDVFPPPFDIPPISMVCLWHDLLDGSPAHIWLREEMSNIASQLCA